jgi:hypothetical protein
MTTDDRLRTALRHIHDSGYQPMYNGRPSCPFCHNFVDAEETHTPDCPLVVALGASEPAGEREHRYDGALHPPEPAGVEHAPWRNMAPEQWDAASPARDPLAASWEERLAPQPGDRELAVFLHDKICDDDACEGWDRASSFGKQGWLDSAREVIAFLAALDEAAIAEGYRISEEQDHD